MGKKYQMKDWKKTKKKRGTFYPVPTQPRYYIKTSPELFAFLMEKGPVFFGLWKKRVFSKKGMTQDTIDILKLFAEDAGRNIKI